MKSELTENAGCFHIQLTAENLEEAALISRFGLNHLKKINSSGVTVQANGKFELWLVTDKRVNATDYIGQPK